MRPKDPSRESIDPRRVLKTGGKQALASLLRSAGYVPQEQMLGDLALALRRAKPLLLGGPRGSGKTAVGEDLAAACNLLLFSVPGHEAIEARDMMGGWDRAEQESAVRQAIGAGMSLLEARAQKWLADFYESGELLDAYKEAARAASEGEPPPVLLLDEVEKLPLKLQHTLLQPLGRGFADVPKLSGVFGVADPEGRPVVLLTSNDLGLLGEPLTSRCFVTWVRPPSPAEEVRILRARVPDAKPELLAGVAAMIHYIREEMPEMRNGPGIRESVDLLAALAGDRVGLITVEVVCEYLACLGKGRRELEVLAQNDDALAWAAGRPAPEIIGWVEEAIERDGCEARNGEAFDQTRCAFPQSRGAAR
jgi:MoxR-like ATPase